MTEDKHSTKALRTKDKVIDQRQQQIDPAGHHRVDPNEAARRSQKQPGQDLTDPHRVLASSNDPKRDTSKLDQPGRPENAQGKHAGSEHAPEAFDSKNPEKQGVGVKEQGSERKKPAQDR